MLALVCIPTMALAQTAVTIQPPNLSGAVSGSLAGRASVGAGAATYSVSIAVPPGTAGMAPGVSLNYSSQSGMGTLGRGWAVGGQSSIARCGKTLAIDKVRTAVSLDANDQFCLDGQRLLPATGSNGTEYRTRIDGFSKIVPTITDAAKGPDSWRVYLKSGQVMTYGGTADATFDVQGGTRNLRWALSRSQDRRGSYSTISYAKNSALGEMVPTRIRYTGNDSTGLLPYNAVNFVYETRPDPWQGYVAGNLLSRTQRLTAIQTRVDTAADGSGGTLVRDYRVAYKTNPINGRSLVDAISDCDSAGNCLPATRFAWTVRDPAAETFAAAGSGNWGGPVPQLQELMPVNQKLGSKTQQVQTQVLMGDFDGDGAVDLARSDGNGNWRVCLSRRTTFTCQSWAGPANGDRGVAQGDFNGDGRMDIAWIPVVGSSTWSVCLSTGSGFSCSDWAGPSFGGPVADFNGDGRDDILAVDKNGSKGGSRLCTGVATGGGCIAYDTAEFVLATLTDWESGPTIKKVTGDFNGDGRADFLITEKSGAWSDASVFLSTDQGLVRSRLMGATDFFLPPIPDPGTTILGDQNGDPYDSYSDALDSHSLNGVYSAKVCRSTGVSWSCSPILGDFAHGGYSDANVGDYDGDGRADPAGSASVCQMGDSAPYQFGATYGGGVNVACRAWTMATPGTPTATYVGDFNGDGIPDRAYYIAASNSAGSWYVALTGNGGTTDLLESVTDGEGHQTQFSYKRMDDTSVYTRGADVAWPLRNTVSGPPLVAQRRVANGQGGWLSTDYRYQGLRSNQQGLGSVGFETIESTDQATGTTTLSRFKQDDPFIGMPVQTKATQANGVVLSQTDSTLASFATTGGALFTYTSSSTSITRDLNNALMVTRTTQVNANGIDAFGNITSSSETVSGGGDSFTTTTTNTYDNLTGPWLIGLLRKSVVAKSAQQAGDVAATPAALTFSACNTSSPAAMPALAWMSCTLGNTGQTVAASIAYAAPAGMTVNGPANCSANTADCGAVVLTSGAAAGTYGGTLSATPSPAGSAASKAVSLTVAPPPLVFVPVSTQWSTIGAASDSGDWPTIKNNSSVSLLITAHTTAAGPGGMWSWQGQAGYCQPGSTVLAPGASCQTFFGTGGLATAGSYTATDQIGYQVVGATGTTYTVQQGYGFSMASTTPSVSSLSFGNVPVNTTSAAQSLTLTNNATNGGTLANLSIALSGTKPGDFALTHSCGTALAAGAACTVTVSFKPTAIANGIGATLQVQGSYPRMQGGATGGIILANGVNLALPVAGNGTGTIATLTSAANLVVPATWYGGGTQTVTATYRNDGNLPMSLASPALAAPLSVASNGCSAVATGGSCNLVIAAATNVPGIGQTQSFVPAGATTAPASTGVTWTTQSAVPRWSSTALAFGNVAVGSSASQGVNLINDGNVAYNWAANSAVVNLPAGFAVNTGACSNVAPGGSCPVTVSFAPGSAGSASGSGLTMSAASFNANSFSVSGTGYILPNLTAVSNSVSATSTAPTQASVYVGYINSAPTATTLTLSISGAGLTLVPTTANCGASTSCGGFRIDSSAAAGVYTGTITGTSSMGGSVPPISVTLTVLPTPSNTTVTVNPTSLAFGSHGMDQTSAVQTVTVSNTGAAPAALNFTWPAISGGANFGRQGGTCVDGAQLGAGASCTVGVVFITGCTAGTLNQNIKISGANFPTASIGVSGTIKTGKCT
ncbi:choice-of-anchor D domain-containing protein [Rhizobacter sp. SG703]|uniref:choice-of-anchor D domain-containing protein n=1 Tax=Rhizobacter sp. SG703 TaxID=2587140 RepID=UPI001447B277